MRDCIACACVSPGLTVAVDPLGTIVTIPLLPLGGEATIPHRDRDAGIVPGTGGSAGGREGKSWMGGVVTQYEVHYVYLPVFSTMYMCKFSDLQQHYLF